MKLQSINPYNSEIIFEIEEYSDHMIEEILSNVAKAYQDWKKRSFSYRSDCMYKVAAILEERSYEFAKTITKEMGKPIKESLAEVKKCAWVSRYYADNAEQQLSPEYITTEALESRIEYDSIGTVLGIMPWNFPYWQVFRYLTPNLMSGNTAILKHASNVQQCALQIEEVFREAGFPENVFRTIVISSSRVNKIIQNKNIKGITLTGSEEAGKTVAEESGRNIKKSVLELGGSNAFIILDDASMEKTVETAVTARFMNGGQSCIAAKRFLIHEKCANDFIFLFKKAISNLKVGDPMKETTDIGPLSSIKHAQEVERQVSESIIAGAVPEIPGKRNQAFFGPALLLNVKPGMPVFDEEVFGPVAPIITFQSDEEAIQLSNASNFGLGASICTENRKRAESMIPLLEEGSVFINELVKSDPRLPFGGIKNSGFGRELSIYGIREFVNIKTIYIK